MASVGQARATLEDLHRAPGKAELVAGRIVTLLPPGSKPKRVARRILRSLEAFASRSGRGLAIGDDIGFAVPELSSGRESFSPDAAYFTGELRAGMHPFSVPFIAGTPALAVEVRSENDYDAETEREMAEKRSDYFTSGTSVVWDVDPTAECIHVYRAIHPQRPTTFHRGQVADAEPVTPGWRVEVDDFFD